MSFHEFNYIFCTLLMVYLLHLYLIFYFQFFQCSDLFTILLTFYWLKSLYVLDFFYSFIYSLAISFFNYLISFLCDSFQSCFVLLSHAHSLSHSHTFLVFLVSVHVVHMLRGSVCGWSKSHTSFTSCYYCDYNFWNTIYLASGSLAFVFCPLLSLYSFMFDCFCCYIFVPFVFNSVSLNKCSMVSYFWHVGLHKVRIDIQIKYIEE